jgi:HK97 family phage prohead protease
MKQFKRTFDGSAEIVQRDGEETMSIRGNAIVFNRWSHNLGDFREKILPDAVRDVDLSNVIATRNHDFDKPLGRVNKGTLELEITPEGVRYTIPKMPNTTVGRDTLEDVRNGNIDGASFMFLVRDEDIEWNFETENGVAEATIKRISKIIELGPVTMPAYPDTTATRSMIEIYEEAKKRFEIEKNRQNLVPNTIDEELEFDLMRAKFNF